MNGYELSRIWFDFCFENPEKIKPNHTAVYFFAIEHCNRLGWKRKFGFPSAMAMEAIGIKSYNTYIKTLVDLVEFGFIEMVQKSSNQYSSNIIALSKYDKANDKALNKALLKHTTKHMSKQSESTCQSTDSINKQRTKNKEQRTKNNIINPFKKLNKDEFWKDIVKSNEEKKYPQKMIEEFFLYWSEPDTKGVMRFQLNKTWCIMSRLATWAKKGNYESTSDSKFNQFSNDIGLNKYEASGIDEFDDGGLF